MAMLVAAATAMESRAMPVVQTNTQVLDNISVQLKVYSQGALGHSDKSLVVTPTTLTTSDIIQQLDVISGFKANPKTSKLVSSTLYSNVLERIPNTVSTNFSVTIPISGVAGGGSSPNFNTNFYIVYGGSTNFFLITTAGAGGHTNGYIITNNSMYVIDFTMSPPTTNIYENLPGTNSVIYSFGGTVTTTADPIVGGNTPLTATAFSNAPGYWVTIIPTIVAGPGGSTNVVITQYSPMTTNVFTNVPPVQYCIMTAKSGGTFDLYDVSDWININNYSPIIYKETGTHLTETNFLSTNIAAQTAYSRMDVSISIVYGTNGTVTGQTNLALDPFGLATSTGKIINLVKGGTAAEKQDFSVFYKTTIDGTSTAYIGGSFTANGGPVYTNSVTGVTNTPTFNPGEYIYFFDGTFQTNNYDVPQTNTISATPALVNGTVTLTYLSAGVEVMPIEP